MLYATICFVVYDVSADSDAVAYESHNVLYIGTWAYTCNVTQMAIQDPCGISW